MYLNNFSVRIPQGKELAGGYVELEHGAQYSLRLRNSWGDRRCDARVEIDGKHVGTWRIPAGESIVITRPVHDDGKFTFYRSGTNDAKDAGLDDVPVDKLGLVQVTFTLEEKTQYYQIYYSVPMAASSPPLQESYVCNTTTMRTSSVQPKSLNAGGTGLSGKSDQTFGTAPSMNLDMSKQTIISLRLVAKSNDSGPRPLTQFSTPVPPPIK